MKSVAPRSCSNWRICWLTAGCVRESSSAAFVKLRVSLTFIRVSSLESIMNITPLS